MNSRSYDEAAEHFSTVLSLNLVDRMSIFIRAPAISEDLEAIEDGAEREGANDVIEQTTAEDRTEHAAVDSTEDLVERYPSESPGQEGHHWSPESLQDPPTQELLLQSSQTPPRASLSAIHSGRRSSAGSMAESRSPEIRAVPSSPKLKRLRKRDGEYYA